MKKRLFAVFLLLPLLLTACDVDTLLVTTSGQDNVTINVPPPGFRTDKAAPELYYDEILSVEDLTAEPSLIKSGYFTVCQDGQWGLIRADGTKLLPCKAELPVAWCGEHWLWYGTEWIGDLWEWQDEELQAAGESGICPGHGTHHEAFYLLISEANKKDLGCLADSNSEGFINLHSVEEKQIEAYGLWLPASHRWLYDGDGDPDYLSEPFSWSFVNAETSEWLDTYAGLNWFMDQPLAPAKTWDGPWKYVSTGGRDFTDAVYAPVYGGWAIGDYNGPTLAAYLQNGYAAVRRDGQENGWGLLDAAGTEIEPANNAGIAWDGDTLWRRVTPQAPWVCYIPGDV